MIRGCSITSRTGSARQTVAQRRAEMIAILSSMAVVGTIIAMIIVAGRSVGM